MNCIRCGRETEEDQVFCSACLKDMDRHPVNPGTPIQLPNRTKRTPVKRTGFKMAATKWENRLYKMKSTIALLIVLTIFLALGLIVCVCLLIGIAPDWLYTLLDYSQG